MHQSNPAQGIPESVFNICVLRPKEKQVCRAELLRLIRALLYKLDEYFLIFHLLLRKANLFLASFSKTVHLK